MIMRLVPIATAILILFASSGLTGDTKSARGPSSCCLGDIRGNVDYDSYDLVGLTDLVTLVDWMFRGGPEPLCLREANVDGSCCADPPGERAADIDISDLVYLVDFLFTGGPLPAPSPTPERWEKTYGGVESEHASSVIQMDDGGYVIVGGTSSFGSGSSDIYLIRTDSWGDTVWTKTYGGPGADEAYSVVAVEVGGFVMAGYTNSYRADEDIYVLKVDDTGGLVWEWTYGGSGFEFATSAITTPDGGILVAGLVVDSVFSEQLYLTKLDASGNSIWAKSYGGPTGELAMSVAATSDGGYIAAGQTINYVAGFRAIYLVKTDSLGDSMWTRTYDSGFYGRAVTPTDDGGYILVGKTRMSHHTNEDLYVVKTDSIGDTVWTRFFGDGDNSFGTAVMQTDDGGYVVAGTLAQRDRVEDACLIKLDATGATLWSRVFGGADLDYGQSMVACSDGGYIVVGGSDSFQNDGCWRYDVYLIKTDAEGYSHQLTK